MINISENVFRIGCTFQGVALIYFLNVSEARGASTSTYNKILKRYLLVLCQVRVINSRKNFRKKTHAIN